MKSHDSQAYRHTEMTREHISFTFDLTDMLLTVQICFHTVRAVVACVILFWAINCSKVSEVCYSTQPLTLYLEISLDAISSGQDAMVNKIMLNRWIRSQVNLKPAFVVSALQVPCHQQICFDFWGLAPKSPLILTVLRSVQHQIPEKRHIKQYIKVQKNKQTVNVH